MKKIMRVLVWGLCFLAIGWLGENKLQAQDESWTVEVPTAWILSSPGLTDLNGDSIKDVVIGGGAERAPLDNGILAIDGDSGRVIWRLKARDQVYGTPLFFDLSGDGVKDIFICGRDAIFMAIDGKKGEIIWEFWTDSMGDPRDSGWLNFYQPQLIKDLNGDQVPDLLTSNGGDNTASGSNRPEGSLMILSGADGRIIARDTVPDGKETYFAPLFHNVGGTEKIIFGSGGESIGGSLWEVSLNEFLQNGLKNARALLTDNDRGFIAHPSWADMNGDGLADLIVPQHKERLWALDLANDRTIWGQVFPGYQLYAAPALGQFTGDNNPDIYLSLSLGVFPFYQDYKAIMVDGADGNVAWTDTTVDYYPLSQANVLDWDGDGWDEVLRLSNQNASINGRLYFNQFEIIDFNDQTQIDVGMDRPGLNVFSTPTILDLDNDQQLDILFAYTPDIDQWAGNNGSRVARLEIPIHVPAENITWGAYLGNQGNGSLGNALVLENETFVKQSWRAYPNPFGDVMYLQGVERGAQGRICDISGRIVKEFEYEGKIRLHDLAPGMYVLEVNGIKMKVVKQ